MLFCLIFGFGIGASQANASYTPINFANIAPIKYGNSFSDILASYKQNEAAEDRRLKNEGIRLENAFKQAELKHALEMYKHEAAIIAAEAQNIRHNSENIYLTKTSKPRTVRIRGYYRKNGTYVKPHYRSRPTRKK